jgi:hypothetical protein
MEQPLERRGGGRRLVFGKARGEAARLPESAGATAVTGVEYPQRALLY